MNNKTLQQKTRTHQLRIWLFLFMTLLFPLSTFAYDFEVDGIYYNFNKNSNTATVTYGDNYPEASYSGVVSIPESVEYYGDILPVTNIGADAFRGSIDLVEVSLPNTIRMIGYGSFQDCSGLKKIAIPNSVKYIEKSAFQDCGRLTELTIGSSVTNIGEYAFYGCAALTSVMSLNTTPPAIYNASTFDAITERSATLHVPAGCKSVYQTSGYWKYWNNIQEDVANGVENIYADGKRKHSTGYAIYSIGGTKLNTADKDELPSGFYIIDGKKVYVKGTK